MKSGKATGRRKSKWVPEEVLAGTQGLAAGKRGFAARFPKKRIGIIEAPMRWGRRAGIQMRNPEQATA